VNEQHEAFASRLAARYLKAAFWYQVNLPALGGVPINALAVLGFGILGFAESALWLVGLGLEGSYLLTMMFNPRFQRLVNGRMLEHTEKSSDEKRRELLEKLPASSQRRLAELETDCGRVLEINQESDDLATDTNRKALGRLQWAYLKLLVARHNLESLSAKEPEAELAKKMEALDQGLRGGADSESLRRSKAATLDILRERLDNVRRRKESLEEIDSDLARIEAQVQLTIENASIQGRSHAVSTEIDMASSLVGSSIFGDSHQSIEELDREYGGGSYSRSPARERS